MPAQAPFLASQISIRKQGEMSSAEAAFYAQMASGIQGTSDDEEVVKNDIKLGIDPSKPTAEHHESYMRIRAKVPAFGAKLESLYQQFEQKNVLTGNLPRTKDANKKYGGLAPFEPGSYSGPKGASEVAGR
jgi:hypothetical protein